MRLRVKDFTTKVGSGITPKGGAESYLSCGIPLFRSQNITNNGLQMADIAFISRETHQLMSGTQLKPNDVLLNITGASIGRCFYLPKDFKEGNVNQHVCILRPTKKIQTQFLHYLLISESGQTKIDLAQTGANREGLSKEDICSFSFDIPSLSEQNRIVAYLDEKTAAIDKQVLLLEQKKEKYTLLRKSIIKKAVTEGVKGETRDWKWMRFKDISHMYSGLTGKSGDDFRCEDESITKPFIPFTNILNNDVIRFDQFKSVVMGNKEEQNRVQENDLLFLMSSEDYESIGKASVVLGNPGEVYLNSFCRGLRFKNLKKIYPRFVCYQLGADKFRDALRFEARGFTRINLKIDRIECMSIALPLLSEQRAIADYLDEKCAKIDAIVANINQQIEKYKLLRRALINEVVTGQKII